MRFFLPVCLLLGIGFLPLGAQTRIVTWGQAPANPPTFTDITAVSAGAGYALALRANGTVVAWGGGVAVNVPPGLTDVVAISAGRTHALAVKRDGTVVGWGDNAFGKATTPAGVTDVVAVAAGYSRSIALRRNGTVAVWGDPRFCQNLPQIPGNLVAIAVAVGWNTDFAVRSSDGTLVAGCNNTNDGNGAPPAGLAGVVAVAASSTDVYSFTLALRGDGSVVGFGRNNDGQVTIPAGLSDVVAISAGGRHSLALRRGGTVVAWGSNGSGRSTVPAGLANVVGISAGDVFSVALVDETPALSGSCSTPNGTAGVNYLGQLNASGGTPPYSWNPQLISGSLPGGLVLAANGQISGIPQVAGSSVFEARVIDAVQRTATVGCAITVTPVNPSCQGLAATQQPGVQGPNGGAGTLTIGTTCHWTASTETPWITLPGPTTGVGNGVLNYQVAAYPNSSVPRVGTILVNQTAVQILQNPGTCNSLLSEISRPVPAAGAEFSVSVFSAPASCAWSAESNVPWIRILQGADSTSGNEVRLKVDLHTGTTPRVGTVTIAGRTFTVTQALGAGCEPQLVPGIVRVAAAGTSLVNVQVLTACAFTARSDVPWIRVVTGGSSSGFLGLEVLGNLTAVPRRGTVTVGSRVLSVEQAAGGCGEVSLSPASIAASPGGGTFRVNFKAPPGCGAPALASGVPWVTAVVSGGAITVTVAANGGTAVRSGAVTVSGSYRIVVTQAAAAAFSCTASSTPVDVREEGVTELAGRYILTCGGAAPAAIRTDVLLKVNTSTAAASDTLLVLDDGAPVTVGVNAFRGAGVLAGGVRFARVPLAVAGVNPQRRWQVFNLRVDASRVAAIRASASMRGIPVTNAEQVVANARDGVRGTIGGSGLAVTATFVELMPNALRTQAEEGGLVVNGSIGLATTGTRLVMMLRLPLGAYAVAQQSAGARLIGVTDTSISVGEYRRQLVWEVTSPNPNLIDSITVSALLGGFLVNIDQIRNSGRAVLGPFEGSGLPRFLNPLVVRLGPNLRLTQRLEAGPTTVTAGAFVQRSPTGNRSVMLEVNTTNDDAAATSEEVVIRGNLPSGLRFTSCEIEGGDPANCSLGEGTFSAIVPKLDAGEANRVRLAGLLDDVDGSLVNVDVSASSGVSVAEDSAEQCLAGISALPQPVAAGASGTFEVYACDAWTLTSEVPWIRFTPSSGTGNTTVQYVVDANLLGTVRAGKVTYPGGGTLTVTQLPAAAGSVQSGRLRFVPVEPCRLVETRAEYNFQGRTGAFGPPGLVKGESRTLVLPGSNVCAIPAAAKAYVLNVAAIPKDGKVVERVVVWPAGEPRPPDSVRTVSSPDGQIVANTAIVKANGSAVSVYASDAADLIVDITGYFTDPGAENLVFYPLTPCRVTDTRALYRTQAGPFGPPSLVGRATRRFAVPQTPYCTVPASARAYSVTLTVAPPGPLAYLTMWPAGAGQPNVSSINSFVGRTLANNVIVPAGAGGALDVFVFDNTDLLIDINGYFAPDDGSQGLYYYPMSPCVALDTTVGGIRLADEETRTIPLVASSCGIPATAKGYVLNATSIPDGREMPFLTMWPTGQARPIASVSNAFEGQTVTNSSLVPAGANGSVDVFSFRRTHVVVDVSGYFQR